MMTDPKNADELEAMVREVTRRMTGPDTEFLEFTKRLFTGLVRLSEAIREAELCASTHKLTAQSKFRHARELCNHHTKAAESMLKKLMRASESTS